MPYDYTCDRCDTEGTTPAIMGQFAEQVWMSTEFGGLMQDRGYELGDTVTLCPTCSREILK